MVLQVFPLAWYMSMLAWRSLVHQPDCDAFSEPILLQTDPITDHSAVRRVLKDMLLCPVEVDDCRFPTGYGYASGLMVAAKEGYTDLVSELADKANNIDVACYWRSKALMLWRSNALMLAAENGHHHAVSVLLEHGANVTLKPEGAAALLHAVQNCHDLVVSVLLDNGADPNTRYNNGNTVLTEAAKNCQPQIISRLLENGADPNMQSTRWPWYTPLMMAAETGNNQACLVLLNNGADVNLVTDEDMTALKIAAENDQIEVVKTLLAHGADINYNLERKNALILAGNSGYLDIFAFLLANGADMSSLNNIEDGYTPLIYAVQSVLKPATAINIIPILLDHGAEINLRNEYGDTALMKAAAGYGKETIVAALLDYGADVNLQNNVSEEFYNYTALMYAAKEGRDKTVSMLLDNGADPKIQSGHGLTALSFAGTSRSIASNSSIVDSLLAHGADVNIKDNNECTALMYAILNNYYNMITTLLNNGADTNVICWTFTPLMLATRRGNIKTMEILIDHGLDVNQRNKEGMSSLFLVRNIEKTNTLLEYGADVNLKDNNGSTPLMYAVRKRHNQGSVVKLIDHGAEVNIQDMQGVTALMFTCQYGNKHMLAALLDAGADIDMQDKDGSTALIHAATVGHDEAVSVLLDYGADVNKTNTKGETALMIATSKTGKRHEKIIRLFKEMNE